MGFSVKITLTCDGVSDHFPCRAWGTRPTEADAELVLGPRGAYVTGVPLDSPPYRSPRGWSVQGLLNVLNDDRVELLSDALSARVICPICLVTHSKEG